MITNLFSSFDPSTNWFIPLNWLRALIILYIIPSKLWKVSTKINLIFKKIKSTLHLEFKTILGPGASQGSTIIFVALLLFIAINNAIGLLPYIFTASSHLTLTLALALPLWLSFLIYGWINHTIHILAHLVPNGTPSLLMPFIVLIETISNLIRPITLSVRLMANIVAGHLLLTLLGNQTALASNLILSGLIFTQILLLTLESAVAIIQSYVFAVLATLYSREIVNH